MTARCEICGKKGVKRTVPVPVARFALDTKVLYADRSMILCAPHAKTYRLNFKGYVGERELVEQRKPKVKA